MCCLLFVVWDSLSVVLCVVFGGCCSLFGVCCCLVVVSLFGVRCLLFDRC